MQATAAASEVVSDSCLLDCISEVIISAAWPAYLGASTLYNKVCYRACIHSFVANAADKAITLQMTYAIKFCRGLSAWFLDWIIVLLITVTLNFKGDSPIAAGTVQRKSPHPLDRQYHLRQNDFSLSGQCLLHSLPSHCFPIFRKTVPCLV